MIPTSDRPRVLILRNPRETGGPQAHIKGWRDCLDELHCDVVELSPSIRWTRPWQHLSSAWDVLRGRAVPETAMWAPDDVRQAVDAHQPDVILVHTSRSLLPILEGLEIPVVIDFVDSLAKSYEQRAAVASTIRAHAFRWLARSHRRIEDSPPGNPKRVAVGAADALALNATWIPLFPEIDPTLPTVDWADREFDVVFFGSLNYPPNIEAVKWLATAPNLGRLSVLVAGRRAGDDLRTTITDAGWTLQEDYESVEELANSARVAVVPLRSAAGIQIKVFEAALAGLPQVITPAGRAGFGHPIPATHAETIEEVVEGIRSLLADPEAASELASNAQQTVVSDYSVGAWLPVVARVLGIEPPALQTSASERSEHFSNRSSHDAGVEDETLTS